MKKRATKEQPEIPLEMRRVLMDAFKSVGGQAKFDAWAKRHPTMLYNMLMKLVPSMAQVSAQVDTHVTVHDGEEAKQKLYDAFMRLIEAERNSAGDPAVYVDGERLRDGVSYARIADATQGAGPSSIADQSSGTGRATIDARPLPQDAASYTRLHDDPWRAASAQDAPPAPQDAAPSAMDDGREVQNKNHSNLENEGSPLCGGLRPRSTAHAQPVTAAPRNPTTTDLYYEYMNSGGGGHRTRWDNNQ